MILCIRPSLRQAVAARAITANTQRVVSGTLVLQPAADLLHAAVIVQLLDTSLVDIAGTVIGRQEFRVTGLHVSELPFCVPVPIDMPGHRFSFSAEVRRSRAPMLASGDYVNMAAVTWQPATTGTIKIGIRRID